MLLFPVFSFAQQSFVPSLIPLTNSRYYLGTTSPSTISWKGLIIDQICLTADTCRTTWPTGGGGGSDPFTHPVAGTSASTSQFIFTNASSTFTQDLNISGNSTTTNSTTTSLFATNGTFTNFFGASLTACANATNALTWSAGQFGCNTISGSGGGSDVNWSFFNNSGIKLGTTTNQVLVSSTGHTATTSLAKLEVGSESAAKGSLLVDASTTLQAFTFTNATGTSATTTNLFSTTASTSNLFGASINGFGLVACTGTSALTWTGGLFTCTAQPQGTVTSVATNNGVTGGTITNTGTISLDQTFGQVNTAASTTYVNGITFGRSTTTSATSTNSFSTTASSTNLFGQLINGFGLTACTGTNALTWTGGSFTCTAQPQGTVTSVATNNGVTGGTISGSGTLSLDQTFGAVWTAASTTFVNGVTFGRSTTTQATTTNFSTTNASTTNLFVSSAGGTAGCATFSSTGLISNTGTVCGSGAGSDPFTHPVAGTSASTSNFIFTNSSSTFTGNLNITGNSTTTNATTTNSFATMASSTNLFGANINGFGLTTCSGTSALTWTGGLFTCTAQPQGTVTSVTGTWPITSSGGNTPNITWSGLATSSNISAPKVLYATGANTFESVATSSLVQSTGVNISNGTSAYVIGAQPTFTIDQSFSPTWTGAHIFNNITRSTTTSATTTNFFATTASTTNFYGANLVTCNASTGKITWANGQFGCGTDAGGSATPGGTDGAVQFATTGAFDGNTVQLDFDKVNDKLGIGSTTPSSSLSINAGAGSSTISVGSSTRSIFSIDATPTVTIGAGYANTPILFDISNGTDVGIGTTTPQWGLQISTSTAPQLTISDSASLASNHWSFRNAGGLLYFATSSPTSYATSTKSALSIGSNGQLTLPFYAGTGCAQFDSTGLISNTGTACGSGSGGGNSKFATTTSNYLGLTPNGGNLVNVGIGTSTPVWPLTVSSSTGPQISLTDGSLTQDIWSMRDAGGILYFATSSPSTFATTSPAAFSLSNTGAAFLGIATSTPFARLSVVRDSGTAPLLAVASSTATGSTMPTFEIDTNGHLITSGPTPTMSSCGTSPSVAGNDTSGVILTGSASPTSCTMTFAKAYVNASTTCMLTAAPGSKNIGYNAVYGSSTATTLSFMATSSLATQAAGTMNKYAVSYFCLDSQ